MTKQALFASGEKLRQMHGNATIKYSGYIKIAFALAFVFLVYKFLSMRSRYNALELEILTARHLVSSLDIRGRSSEMKTENLQMQLNRLLKEIDECKISIGDKEVESKKATDNARMCFDLMQQRNANCTDQIENQKTELRRNSDTISRLERTVQEQEANLNSTAIMIAECVQKTVLELQKSQSVIGRRTNTNEMQEQGDTLNLAGHQLPVANDVKEEETELGAEDDEILLNKYKEQLVLGTTGPVADLLVNDMAPVNGQEFAINGEQQ